MICSKFYDQAGLKELSVGLPKTATAAPPRLPGWLYVDTPEDAENLLMAAHGFHDSVLVSLQYTSGAKKLSDGGLLAADHIRQVQMLFHSQWTPPIALIFEAD